MKRILIHMLLNKLNINWTIIIELPVSLYTPLHVDMLLKVLLRHQVVLCHV